eukprot:TRINITY_DN2424_c0_g1_i1.p1 TRINITY_DN2424_c0_g1~~TRINITY_DN2424_c0_g1_i1.p1  ORF type:complete len:157 (-),score=48.95 TRINITY_DN2424_c0_g1_i1:187-657(-)
MRSIFFPASFLLLLLLLIYASSVPHAFAKQEKDVTSLQIGVKYRPVKCTVKAKSGDTVKVHYRGTLIDGEEFDSSYGRNDPFEFKLGAEQVIRGWDFGISGMCVGEKRKLKIPSGLGYGVRGSPPKIPGGATLFFDTELISINGKGAEEEDLKSDL